MHQVVIKNFSSVVSDTDVAALVVALGIQVSRDFAPSWGCDARLRFATKAEKLLSTEWLLGIYDDSDQASALGYHDVQANGTPLGKVFAKTTLEDGGLVSVTTSHELLEMLVDPEINGCSLDEALGRIWATEVCDAVEADELGYPINGVQVSDFVLPNFFTRNATGAPLSFGGHVTRPFSLAPGGYLSYLDLGNEAAGWQQIFADAANPAKRAGTSRGSVRHSLLERKGIAKPSTAES